MIRSITIITILTIGFMYAHTSTHSVVRERAYDSLLADSAKRLGPYQVRLDLAVSL